MNSPSTKPRRWKRLIQNFALSIATFLLCAMGLEVVLRIAGYGNLEIYEPDAKLYWKLKPNQDCYTKVGKKPVHINSQGTRGPEFEIDKPAGTLRILSLGDSRTFGWGLDDRETYSRRLESLLREHAGAGQRVEVINAGVNGWSYPQMHVYFRDLGLRFQPDIVLIGDANLWTQFSEKSTPEFARQFMRRVRLKNLLRRSAVYHFFVEVQLKDFYERHRTRFIPVDPEQDKLFREEQQSDPDALFRSAIHELCALAIERKVKPVLLYLPGANELSLTNTRPLRSKTIIHEQLGVPLVDMSPDLQSKGNALYLEGDPVHFNADGNELIARKLFETLTAPEVP